MPGYILGVTWVATPPYYTYVGVSRVKFLNGLMLEESFDLSRFRGKESITERMRLADAERRRPQHLGL